MKRVMTITKITVRVKEMGKLTSRSFLRNRISCIVDKMAIDKSPAHNRWVESLNHQRKESKKVIMRAKGKTCRI